MLNDVREHADHVRSYVYLAIGGTGGAAGTAFSMQDFTELVRLATACGGFVSVILGIYLAWRSRKK